MQTFWRELERLGHEIEVVAPAYGQQEIHDPHLIRIPSRKVIFDPEDRLMKKQFILGLDKELRHRRFDLIHIQTPFIAHYAGITLSRRFNIPRIETYHTFFEEYLFHYVPFLPKAWLRYTARRFSRGQCNEVDAVVVPSTAMRDVLESYGVTTKLEVLPTGIQLEKFNGGDGMRFRVEHNISKGRPLLLHVGRVAFEKNISFLLRVVQRIKAKMADILFIIAGEGPALSALRREVSSLNIKENVLFLGNLARETALLDCYRAADVKIFASRTETQGLVLLEAMALGVPVVSTAVMGTKDVLQPGCGAAISGENEEEFASTVMRVLIDKGLAHHLSQAGKRYAELWSAPHIARRLVDLYERTVSVCKARSLESVGL